MVPRSGQWRQHRKEAFRQMCFVLLGYTPPPASARPARTVALEWNPGVSGESKGISSSLTHTPAGESLPDFPGRKAGSAGRTLREAGPERYSSAPSQGPLLQGGPGPWGLTCGRCLPGTGCDCVIRTEYQRHTWLVATVGSVPLWGPRHPTPPGTVLSTCPITRPLMTVFRSQPPGGQGATITHGKSPSLLHGHWAPGQKLEGEETGTDPESGGTAVTGIGWRH